MKSSDNSLASFKLLLGLHFPRHAHCQVVLKPGASPAQEDWGGKMRDLGGECPRKIADHAPSYSRRMLETPFLLF